MMNVRRSLSINPAIRRAAKLYVRSGNASQQPPA
jgi:hypothetical protein